MIRKTCFISTRISLPRLPFEVLCSLNMAEVTQLALEEAIQANQADHWRSDGLGSRVSSLGGLRKKVESKG
jgi:post-segregation antitoxin (ccd killing protein)